MEGCRFRDNKILLDGEAAGNTRLPEDIAAGRTMFPDDIVAGNTRLPDIAAGRTTFSDDMAAGNTKLTAEIGSGSFVEVCKPVPRIRKEESRGGGETVFRIRLSPVVVKGGNLLLPLVELCTGVNGSPRFVVDDIPCGPCITNHG